MASAGTSASPVDRVSAREPTGASGAPEAPALSEEERGQREEQEQRLAVHRSEEERGRKQGEKQHGPPCGLRAELQRRQAIEQDERAGARSERDEHACQHGVSAEDATEWPDEGRVDRKERRPTRRPEYPFSAILTYQSLSHRAQTSTTGPRSWRRRLSQSPRRGFMRRRTERARRLRATRSRGGSRERAERGRALRVVRPDSSGRRPERRPEAESAAEGERRRHRDVEVDPVEATIAA